MSQIENHQSIRSSVTQMIQRKYKHLKTLVFKLKSDGNSCDISQMNDDQLDEFVDEILLELQSKFQSNLNDFREQIKQIRPKNTNDPSFEQKMFIYSKLLEEILPMIEMIEDCLNRTLDEFHILIQQISNEIFYNNGNHVDYLIEQHQLRIQTLIQQQFIIYIEQIQFKLNHLQK